MVSPVTIEVIRNVVVASLDEIEQNLVRTAYNPVVYEIRDLAVAWLDPESRIISQGRLGVPVFMADLGTPVQDGLEIYGPDGFEPGDVILTNHAGTCGQHLNNVVVYSPIFDGQEILGFTAARTHWMDIGGGTVGSWDTQSRDIYSEGVQIRTVKIYKGGKRDEELFRILRHNSRFPEMLFGDLNAQIAACRIGEQRYLELVNKYGKAVFSETIQEIWNQSERLAREAVLQIPDGVYEAKSSMDDDGVNAGKSIPIRVKVTVRDSDMEIDFSDMGDQVEGPLNSGVSGGIAVARVAFKYLTTPGFPADDGCFRPLSIKLPPGKLISASEAAPKGLWTIPLPTIIDTILKALSEAIPSGIPAAHMGDMGGAAIYGVDKGKLFYFVDSAAGGLGASFSGDGADAVKGLAHGETYTIPTELEEKLYPLRVRHKSLRADSGGAGRTRGGLGSERCYEVLQDCFCSTFFDRKECPPWGLFGGEDAAPSNAIVTVPGQRTQTLRKTTRFPLPAGSVLLFQAAGGGGYGPPCEREPELVLEDVVQGYVSREAAERDYGVVVRDDGDSLRIEEAETQRLRREMEK